MAKFLRQQIWIAKRLTFSTANKKTALAGGFQ